MSNPFSKDFAPPSRFTWSKGTTSWLKRHMGLGAKELADMLGLKTATLYQMRDAHRNCFWFFELQGALVAGWRPRRDWVAASWSERQTMLEKVITGLSLDEDAARFWFPVGSPKWQEALWEGAKESLRVPPRLAVVADALDAGAVPCGIPFEEWLP